MSRPTVAQVKEAFFAVASSRRGQRHHEKWAPVMFWADEVSRKLGLDKPLTAHEGFNHFASTLRPRDALRMRFHLDDQPGVFHVGPELGATGSAGAGSSTR